MKASDNFYHRQEEPIKGCLQALRTIVLRQDTAISEAWKYGMPFFCYKGKMFCYLWIHKKYKQPYIGMVEGKRLDYPQLITEKRSRMKIMLFDPNEDLPAELINHILQQAINLYRKGVIKIKE